MQTPDFRRIADVAAPYLQKDRRHTLIIFTASGFAIVIWAWFNQEYRIELLSVGSFFIVIGIARYFFERSKRPFLLQARIKKKEAVPYNRIPGTYDYFLHLDPLVSYSFSDDGKFDVQPTETVQHLKISPDIFSVLHEDNEVLILFSATRILVGVLDENYTFTPYL